MDFFSTLYEWALKLYNITGWSKLNVFRYLFRIGAFIRLATVVVMFSTDELSTIGIIACTILTIMFIYEIASWSKRIILAFAIPKASELGEHYYEEVKNTFNHLAISEIIIGIYFILHAMFSGLVILNLVALLIFSYIVLLGCAANSPYLPDKPKKRVKLSLKSFVLNLFPRFA